MVKVYSRRVLRFSPAVSDIRLSHKGPKPQRWPVRYARLLTPPSTHDIFYKLGKIWGQRGEPQVIISQQRGGHQLIAASLDLFENEIVFEDVLIISLEHTSL